MYNWSVDESKLKADQESFIIWRLEQMINFGLGGEKISEANLRKFWSRLNIDPKRKEFLSILLNESETHTNSKPENPLASSLSKSRNQKTCPE